MDASNTPQVKKRSAELTDAEAEAALLALAEPLAWKPGASQKLPWFTRRLTSMCFALAQNRIYIVQIDGKWFHRWYWATYGSSPPTKTESSEKQYQTVAEAKMACERHHATGEWD